MQCKQAHWNAEIVRGIDKWLWFVEAHPAGARSASVEERSSATSGRPW
jgi:hypothetical protein